MAKHHFDVPRTIARVNNPKNEVLFRHLGVDELVSPTRMILGSIEQDIPVHELLHLAALGEGELELIEAHLQAGRRRSAGRRGSSTCRRAVRCSPSSATGGDAPPAGQRPARGRQGHRHRQAGVRGAAARPADRGPGGDRAPTPADRGGPPGAGWMTTSQPERSRNTLDNGIVSVLACDMASQIRPERDPERPVYVISVAATLVSAHPRTLRIYEDEGSALSGTDADQHPSLFRERHPAAPVDPPPDPRARREPRRDPHPVRARGAPRRPHPGGPVRRRDGDAEGIRPPKPDADAVSTHPHLSIDRRQTVDRTTVDPPSAGTDPADHEPNVRRTSTWPSDRPPRSKSRNQR